MVALALPACRFKLPLMPLIAALITILLSACSNNVFVDVHVIGALTVIIPASAPAPVVVMVTLALARFVFSVVFKILAVAVGVKTFGLRPLNEPPESAELEIVT